MSEIKVNSIKGVGASSAAITVNNADGTATANLTNRQNRNLIINGAMQVAQRGTSTTTSGGFCVDRFQCFHGGTDEAPTFAQADVSSGTTPYTLGFRKSLKVTNGNQTSGAGASDYVWFQNKYEAQDIANSGWNYTSSSSFITLSFWVKSSVAQNFYGYYETLDSPEYIYPFETGSLTADTWTKVTKVIPGNSNLVFNNDNGVGLNINLLPFFGTDFTDSGVSLNTWKAYASSARTPDYASTWYTTNDATFEFTGVQLEVGSVATDFEHRSFGQELALCQRYFMRIPNQDASTGYYVLAQGAAHDTNSFLCNLHFPTFMRANPSMSTPGSLRAYNGGGLTITSLVLNTASVAGACLQVSTSSGISAKDAVSLGQNNDPDSAVDFSAEL